MSKLILSKTIQKDLGVTSAWISARFSRVVEEGMQGTKSVYHKDKLLEAARKYKSFTRNPKQKAISEKMVSNLVKYLEASL